MSTIREQILAAVKTAVTPTSGVSSNVFRSRQSSATRADGPVIFIEPVGDNADQTTLPRIDWAMIVRFKIACRGAIPDQVADPILDSMHNLLMTDASLQALIMDVQPMGVNWQFTGADNDAVLVSCDYRILYKTSQNNLSSLN